MVGLFPGSGEQENQQGLRDGGQEAGSAVGSLPESRGTVASGRLGPRGQQDSHQERPVKAAVGVRISGAPSATPEPHTRPGACAHGSGVRFLPLAPWLSNPLGP